MLLSAFLILLASAALSSKFSFKDVDTQKMKNKNQKTFLS